MDKKAFIEELIKKIKVELPECEISHSTVKKNNSVICEAITIKKENSNISPVLYLDESDFQNATDDVAKKILNSYRLHENDIADFQDISKFMDYENYVKKHIVYSIVSKSRNKEDRPSVDLSDDLKIVFKIYLSGTASIPVMNSHLEYWGNPAIEELLEASARNTETLDRAIFKSIEDMLFKSGFTTDEIEIDKMIEETIKNSELKMFVLTTKSGSDAALLYDGLLNKIKENIGAFYVIPSSTSEFIIAPVDGIDPITLTGLIREINETVVDDISVLSDYPLIFDDKGLRTVDINKRIDEIDI